MLLESQKKSKPPEEKLKWASQGSLRIDCNESIRNERSMITKTIKHIWFIAYVRYTEHQPNLDLDQITFLYLSCLQLEFFEEVVLSSSRISDCKKKMKYGMPREKPRPFAPFSL